LSDAVTTRLFSAIGLALPLLTLTLICLNGPPASVCAEKSTGATLGIAPTSDDFGPSTVGETIGPQGGLLRSFTASAALDHVVVAWETAMEIGLGGFDVGRSRHNAGPYVPINPTMIAPQRPGSSLGAAYTYTDTTVTGGPYWYRLTVSKTWGTEWSQPVAVALHRVYLPLVRRQVDE
jgi:hypothetical protein